MHQARTLLIHWYSNDLDCIVLSLRSPPLDFYVVQYSGRRRRHRTLKEFVPRATKLLFEKDNAWKKVLWKHAQTFSLWQITCVERMLSCGTNMMGAKHYDCGTPDCPHTKVICQNWKTKACRSCGTQSTEQWISTLLDVMPDSEHQHITFTMPSELWPIFEANPTLLNDLFSLAADTLLKWAKKHSLEVGIFGALNTYGRALNWHPHIRLSVTRGGLDKHNTWKPIYFKKKHVEYHWRRTLIRILRQIYDNLNLPTSTTNHIQDFNHGTSFFASISTPLEYSFRQREIGTIFLMDFSSGMVISTFDIECYFHEKISLISSLALLCVVLWH